MSDVHKKIVIIEVIAAVIICAVTAAVTIDCINNDPSSTETALTVTSYILAGVGVLAAIVVISHQVIQKSRDLTSVEKIMHQLNSMVILWDTSFEYVRANDTLIRASGYSEDEFYDPEVLHRLLPSDAFSENLQSIVNNKDEEFFIKAKNGTSICTVWNTSIVYSYAERNKTRTIMMSIGPNLTEINKMRREIELYSQKLSESEKRYSLSMELSEIGLLLKESGSTRYYVSDGLCKMFGIESTSGYVEGEILRECFHPKDKIVFDSFASCGKNENVDAIHSVDFRVLGADEQYHWFNFRYKAVCGENTVSIGGAVMDISREKDKDLMIEHMAYIDDVTQIYNRNKFMLMGNEILECARADSTMNYWVIVIDIDSFHIINDTCGYANGDHLLKEVASILTANLSEGGLTARIGGDNFAMLIRATDDDTLPIRYIKHVQSDIANIGGMGLETQNITCSAGYCLMTDGDNGDFAQVLDRAEFALSLSDGTKGSVLRFDNHAHDAIIAGNEIEKDLSKALDNHELVLYYQPKINLENGQVIGMEALIRWVKPDGTIIPPSDFIPVAENSLLITHISKFVLYEACRQNKEWQDMGLDPITVSINLSAIDFYQTNVTESIREALAKTGLSAQWLDVELTESLALKDIDHAVIQMNEIKDLGVKLSMDDFGTGYSSLSYIQILPITILKLDRSFIMYLEEDEISREIVSAVIRIAKSKKIETIAEGIETIEQAEILKRSGCDHAQGYFFGKPMPAKQFEAFMRARQSAKA